jgi:hypothetical protein
MLRTVISGLTVLSPLAKYRDGAGFATLFSLYQVFGTLSSTSSTVRPLRAAILAARGFWG